MTVNELLSCEMANRLDIKIRTVTRKDIALVAAMNQRLVEDEGSRNPFTDSRYRERIREWLFSGDWELVLFTDSADTSLGYATYRIAKDEYCQKREVVHLRQFFIDRPFRGRGYGRSSYALLAHERFEHREVTLDVLTTNPGGRRFWAKLGFSEHYVSMKSGDKPLGRT